MPPSLPNGFVGQKSILRQLVLPANAQTSWGTPTATTAFTVGGEALRYDVAGFAKFPYTKESTYGTAGATNSFANDNWLTAKKSSIDISGQLTDWIAGFLFAFGMGKDVVTGVAAPYTHTLNFLDSGNIAQGTTLYGVDTAALAYQLVDMGLSQLTITSSGTGSLKFKASFIGTGRVVAGTVAGVPVPVQRQHLLGSDTVVSIGPSAGALTSVYPRCKSWELSIDCGIAEERPSGSGLYASHLVCNMPKVKLKMVIAADHVDDIYAWKTANTLLQATLVTTSGAAILGLTLPNFTLDDNCALGDVGGTACWTIDLSETDILQIGASPLLTVAVTNGVASYLVAA
jgi:hypothetical protein